MLHWSTHTNHVAPEEEPVKPRAVVEDYHTWPPNLVQVPTHTYSYPEHQLCRGDRTLVHGMTKHSLSVSSVVFVAYSVPLAYLTEPVLR